MNTFQYARPETVAETLVLLHKYGSEASLLTGGTDLLVRLRKGRTRPRLVIDLKRVLDLRSDIRGDDSFLEVGALAVLADVIQDERVQRYFPALGEAAGTVGSVQIRNRATLAGNICNASPAADTAPALLVYGARVNLVGSNGHRRIPVNEFFVKPGQTALQQGEIVVSIELPLPQQPVGASFVRLTRRRGVDLATVNACCLVDAAGSTQFAYGAVGPRPFLVVDESGCLADPKADEQQKDQVLKQLVAQASPISDVRASRQYRQAMLLVLSRRALQTALSRLSANENS
ncbi:MAG: xanthine dehydrogenase family protein subunit M [Anaerolineales bacterium]|nr:xanthine dehydrogenase family protein subunit M [Anaerolineales bacterium]